MRAAQGAGGWGVGRLATTRCGRRWSRGRERQRGGETATVAKRSLGMRTGGASRGVWTWDGPRPPPTSAARGCRRQWAGLRPRRRRGGGRVAPPHAAACTAACHARSPRAPAAGGTAAPAGGRDGSTSSGRDGSTSGGRDGSTSGGYRSQGTAPTPTRTPTTTTTTTATIRVGYRTPRPVPTARVRPPAAGEPCTRVGAPRRRGTPNRQPPREMGGGRRAQRGARVEREATIHAGRGTRPATVTSEGGGPAHGYGVRWQPDSGAADYNSGSAPRHGCTAAAALDAKGSEKDTVWPFLTVE